MSSFCRSSVVCRGEKFERVWNFRSVEVRFVFDIVFIGVVRIYVSREMLKCTVSVGTIRRKRIMLPLMLYRRMNFYLHEINFF
jgi:hypothetical protein